MADLSGISRVLVVKPSSLGDIIHTLPAVHALRRTYPHIDVTWLVNPEFAPLLDGNQDVSRTLEFPRASFRGPAGWIRFARWLAAFPGRAPDLAIDFQGLLRSGLAARASGARRIAGMDDSREGSRLFHGIRVPVRHLRHAVDRNLALAAALGAATGSPACFPLPPGQPPAEFASSPPPENAVLLHPFSRGSGKSLTPGQVARLADILRPLPVILAGRVPSPPSHPLPSNVLNLLNRTSLAGLIWLMRQARTVISVDSGPVHIAAAVSPRVLSIHTWTDPRRVGPYRPDAWVWKAGALTRVADADPDLCRTSTPFPDDAIPAVAEWAAGGQ